MVILETYLLNFSHFLKFLDFHTLVKSPKIKIALDLLIQINPVDISLALSLSSMAFRSDHEEMNRHYLGKDHRSRALAFEGLSFPPENLLNR